ncbi:hypothetical protein N9L47_09010 [Rhodobacteraceae bacterium]|nr:hypothetical protein [Paracoccaceae bacterium]
MRTFPINDFQLPSNSEEVVKKTWQALGSWRAFLIAVDGRSGLGKSVFARYLSFRLNMPLFELDEFKTGNGLLDHREELKALIKRRISADRPVIVEGLLAKEVLIRVECQTDWQVRLSNANFVGPEEFRDVCENYEARFTPDIIAKATFVGDYTDWVIPQS